MELCFILKFILVLLFPLTLFADKDRSMVRSKAKNKEKNKVGIDGL